MKQEKNLNYFELKRDPPNETAKRNQIIITSHTKCTQTETIFSIDLLSRLRSNAIQLTETIDNLDFRHFFRYLTESYTNGQQK